MQTNGCPEHNANGETDPFNSQINGACAADGVSNGDLNCENDRLSPAKPMSQTDKDIVRLIGQHLRNLGLK